MKRCILLIATVMTTLVTFGCSMCCGPYDYDYPNFTGEQVRMDPTYGRVGSLFSDPNASFTGDGPDSNLRQPPEVLNPGSQDNDNDLELIDPLNENNPGTDPLPNPPGEDTTASRLWKRQPLRSTPEWR